jgi:glycosyltransferase involved in cell wall biosynthesis
MKPKVSCIIATHNRAKTFLPKAIKSVLEQDFTDWELIIVDDRSTDETAEVVAEVLKDSRITYHRLKKHFGSDTKPKNEGTKLARGEYICYLDDDVQYRKHTFKTLVRVLDQNPDIDVVYGDMWLEPKKEPGIAHNFDAQFLMLRNFIDSSSAMIRRQALFDVGGWDETVKKFVDWNLWVRMVKYGKRFKRVNKFTTDYYLHDDTKSVRIVTPTYVHPTLGILFVPTFDPSGCDIELPYLKEVHEPRVAIFTIHYDRLDYTRETAVNMKETAGYKFDWFCFDNSTTDETFEWLKTQKPAYSVWGQGKNYGITGASNMLIDAIFEARPTDDPYDLIIKVDNDVEFITKDWLKDIVALWKKNHMIYVSPYVEGLYHNPGGAQRVGYGLVGGEFVEVTEHIGGIFAAVSAKAYKNWRWEDKLLHGNQDFEASHAFRLKGYMPCYYPKHIIAHRDTTLGQEKKYKSYFERRKLEKL